MAQAGTIVQTRRLLGRHVVPLATLVIFGALAVLGLARGSGTGEAPSPASGSASLATSRSVQGWLQSILTGAGLAHREDLGNWFEITEPDLRLWAVHPTEEDPAAVAGNSGLASIEVIHGVAVYGEGGRFGGADHQTLYFSAGGIDVWVQAFYPTPEHTMAHAEAIGAIIEQAARSPFDATGEG